MTLLFLIKRISRIFLPALLIVSTIQCSPKSKSIRVGVFNVNVSPPIGSPVAYAKARSIQDPLMAKGIVLLSDNKPVVLCAVDWLGIANEGQDAWRESLAKAAGTTKDHVSVHTVHQHDGCRCDFTTEAILDEYGLGGWRYDTAFLKETIHNVGEAVKNAKSTAQPVTHLGYGQAEVRKVASNRRILGEDGKVKITRWSRSKDPLAIAAPEGMIDPFLRSVSFWNKDVPIVVLNYYTTHPMSHYGKGDVSSDFVGIARDKREKQLGVPHIYFSGPGGNITAGKYNDGSPERRIALTERVEIAMQKAWAETIKTPFSMSDIGWKNIEVLLPLAKHLDEDELVSNLQDEKLDSLKKFTAAKHLAWLRRNKAGHKVNISALNLAQVWLLNLPGETFIEFQLAAQNMKPGEHVCTAAYEEYGPGYICTEIAYDQGGYESSDRASRVSPEAEQVILKAIRDVLTE